MSCPESGVRVDPVLVALLALVLGATAAVAPAATIAAAVAAFGALGRHLGRIALLVAVVSLGVGAGRARLALEAHAAAHAQALRLLPAPSRCAANARVTASPVEVGERLRFDAELRELDCEGRLDARAWPARLYVRARPELWIARGDELAIVADLAPTAELHNLDLPDPRPGAARRGAVLSGGALAVDVTRRASGPHALIDRARAHVRARIGASFGASSAGMARALVLGENDLDPADELAFQQSGLSHLLAVSGTHLILAVLALVRALEAVLRRVPRWAAGVDVRRPAALLGMALAPLYADFAGGSGSAWRAAWMLCAALGVRAAGRHALPSRVFAASLGAGALTDALAIFDPSFVLSAAATAGLLVFGRRLEQHALAGAFGASPTHDLGRLLRAITRATFTTLSASLPCIPVLLSISPGLSLASVAANLLAAPLGEVVALPLCLLHALCWWLPALERGVALVASGALVSIRGVARASASVGWLYFTVPPPGPWHLACIVAGGALVVSACGSSWLGARRSAGVAGRGRCRAVLGSLALTAAGLACAEAASRWPHSSAFGREQQRLRITALDVGQGDALLVDLPDGRLMLIDGGGMVGVPVDPGERVILPTLRARRRSHLDVVVLTHPHPDHFGGLVSVLREVSVGELWYGGAGAAPPPPSSSGARSAYERLFDLAREKHVVLRGASELCGEVALPGPSPGLVSALVVLHPCPAPVAQASANDNSLVLRFRHGCHAALLVGDAERWAEERLLGAHGAALGADYLKVGHHGSRSSSGPAFIGQVAPRFAVISSGVRNRFGHPHPEALAALEGAGARVLRLDRLGAVEWQSDGTRDAVRSFLPLAEDRR